MTSKMDRWKKITKTGSHDSVRNPNKSQLMDDLTTLPLGETADDAPPQGEDVINTSQANDEPNAEQITDESDRSNNTTPIERVEVQSIDNTPKDEVESDSKNITPESPSDNSPPPAPPVIGGAGGTKKRRVQKSDESIITKANSAVTNYKANKQTKDKTHKKTSFLLRFDILAKLGNFDDAHGGRIQGEFINNLLENAFAELEEDPQWKKILNHNLQQKIERLKVQR